MIEGPDVVMAENGPLWDVRYQYRGELYATPLQFASRQEAEVSAATLRKEGFQAWAQEVR